MVRIALFGLVHCVNILFPYMLLGIRNQNKHFCSFKLFHSDCIFNELNSVTSMPEYLCLIEHFIYYAIIIQVEDGKCE
jgi:hypothetical protein